MKKRIRVIIPITILLIIIGYLLVRVLGTREKVIPGTITGNGVIEATEVDVSSKVAGKILSLTVDEGDNVTAGMLIAVLDSGELAGNVEQAKGNLQAAEAALAALQAGSRPEEIARARAQYNAALDAQRQAEAQLQLVNAGPRTEVIRQLQANYHQAQANLKLAQTTLQRFQNLYAKGAISKQQLDNATTARDVAAAAVESARQQLAAAQNGARPQERRQAEAQAAAARSQANAAKNTLDLVVAGPRKEDIAAAKARVDQAKGALQTAQSTENQTRISAFTDGRVTLRNVEPGELVTPGLPIIRIAELRTVWIRVYVPEEQVGQIKVGQMADVITDSIKGTVFKGKVTDIAEQPEFTPKNVQTKEERVKLVFGIKIEVDNPDNQLKPGMPGDAVIYIGNGG